MKKLIVKKSRVHGKGIFADENIRKGERVQFIRGPLMRKRPRNARESRIIGDWVGVGKDLWINPQEPFCYLNHSCEPNVAIAGRRLLVALKNIRRGEEIAMDYSLTDADPHWHIRCYCRAKHCRKHIRAIQSLPFRTFKKYLPNIPPYFQKVYFRAHPHLKQ